ncbi:MAG: ABC transporter ATP-binding protein [Firmicutes bacterium]|nr:ABC transporter ATP-binding protein [Bacillota bacterium]
MLESRTITKTFGSKRAVDGVSIKLDPGHIYGLLGPNGSGKTTWMKMATGLIKPNSGEMLYEGAPVGKESRRHVAYMSTEPFFYSWMTIRDVGKYYADFFEDFSPERYDVLIKRMELKPEMKTKALSSGMMAKLKVAVTMARDAEVYLLDEPFNGIDLLARDEIRQSILEAASNNKVLLISSHLVEEMEAIVDQVIYLKEGQLVEMADLEQMRLDRGISMADRYRQIYGHTEG